MEWEAEQRIELKLKKASKEKDYIKKHLKDCKTWSGPFTSGEELIRAIKLRPEKEDFVVKTEMRYICTVLINYNEKNYTN